SSPIVCTTNVTCEVRLRTFVARPYARGRNRLSVGPSSTHAFDTTRFSLITPGCCSAFAIAESKSFSTSRVAPSGEKRRMRCASATCCPRIMSTTRRIFRGEVRMCLAVAFACNDLPHSRPALVPGVRTERARGCELSELVPDHRLRDEDRHMFAAVVHGDRVPDHVRHHRGTTRPSLDDPLVAAFVHVVDLHHQVLVDERTLLHRPRHQPRPFPRRRTMYLLDALFFFLVRPSFLPHGDVGWRPPEDLPSPPPSGWSTGFIATPRTDGRLRCQRARPALPSWTSSCSA